MQNRELPLLLLQEQRKLAFQVIFTLVAPLNKVFQALQYIHKCTFKFQVLCATKKQSHLTNQE